MVGDETEIGWAVLASEPRAGAAFAVIVLTCAALALRGLAPGGVLAALWWRPPE